MQVVQPYPTTLNPSAFSASMSPALWKYSVATLDPGASEVFTHGFVASPLSTAFFASSPAASITLGLDVLVQLVIAAITTAPSCRSNDCVLYPTDCAVPAPVAARLVADLDDTLAAALSGIEYAGSAVVSLGFRREDVAHPLDAAGVVVPRGEGMRMLAVSFLSSKFPGRAPRGHVLLRTFVGGALDPDAARLDDAALLALVRREIAAVLGARGEPVLVQIDRWHAAMPQYHLGHVDRVERIRQRVATHPRLAFAGAAYEGVGIPQVIASGAAAARACLQ